MGSGCRVEQCTRQFQSSAMANGGVRRGPSGAFCVILRQYSDCLRSTARSCRGHLAYHTTITLVQNWNVEFNCSYVATSALPQRNHDHARPPTNPVTISTHRSPSFTHQLIVVLIYFFFRNTNGRNMRRRTTRKTTKRTRKQSA